MITGVALTASASIAHAQVAQNTTGTSGAVTPAPSSGATTVQEFVVTGSRIPQPNLTSVSPVTAVSSQELKLEGTTRVEDLINQLPQVVADQGGNLANGATGTATLNLRGLGSKRNVVLIDGTRLGPGDPTSPVADINFIPQALVERIDVLTGGASAVYGADAVAGVVNFVMKKDFEGLQLDINAGGYQHSNGDAKSQAANTAAGYTNPASNVFDGQTVDVSAIFGANSPDGKGNVEGYVEYRHIAAVPEFDARLQQLLDRGHRPELQLRRLRHRQSGNLAHLQFRLLSYAKGRQRAPIWAGRVCRPVHRRAKPIVQLRSSELLPARRPAIFGRLLRQL